MSPEDVITNLQYLLNTVSEKILPHIGKVDSQWGPRLPSRFAVDVHVNPSVVGPVCLRAVAT